MAKSFKFKNDYYLDSSSVIHSISGHHISASTIFNRIGNLRCIEATTGDKTYCDVDVMYDANHPYDRRMYMYMGIANDVALKVGFFTYNNGVISNIAKLYGQNVEVSVNSNHTIRFDLKSTYGGILLIGIHPKLW